MPTFVIHAVGQPSQKTTIEKAPVKVGRGTENHLVLGDMTVSREHAVFAMDLARRWFVSCVSETNPIVVDGKMVSKRKYVAEGSEILIGKEHLLVFCASDATATRHLGATVGKSTCKKCSWSGMVRAGSGTAACPECGAPDLVAQNAYEKDQAAALAKEGATSLMSPGQLGSFVTRMRAAKRSRLERTDGRDPARTDLSETDPCALKPGKDAPLRLFGLMLGGGITIAWDGVQFVATSAMWYPGMKVNGERTSSAPLKHGDTIWIGSNSFRFVTD
jgi:hypothetical protein